jgi:putative membrane protein
MTIAEATRSGDTAAPASEASRPGDWAFYLLLAVVGAFLWWASRYHAAAMPAWAPWEFSWSWFLATTLALWWYFRGILRLPKAERPAGWRTACYVAGVLSIYAVLQTRFEYLAEHMFFLNRVQHVVMHHMGPFMIAIAWPGEVLARGMPQVVRRLTGLRPLRKVVDVLQQPAIASFLFVGLVAFWLIPAVHFRAMIDYKLYQTMNWSMVVDGLLFWVLVLDPRPKPPARVSFGGRVAMTLVVVPPQIAIGALIAFTPYDIYSFYAWCGRIYPAVGALGDQQIGGLNIWIPPAMMSGAALLLVVNAFRRQEEKEEKDEPKRDDDDARIAAAGWTGR